MERRIGFEIRTLSNLIKRRSEAAMVQIDSDARGICGWVLGYLYNQGDQIVYQQDFERDFKIRRSTATGIMQSLEKRGFIRRENDAEDKRKKRLILTSEGKAFHLKMECFFTDFEQQIRKGISSEEEETFFAVLEKVKNNLTQE